MNQSPFFYETEIEWKEGTRASSRDLTFLPLTLPLHPNLAERKRVGLPSTLYLASVSACFMTTFLASARLSRLKFAEFSIHARGKLERIEDNGFQITRVALHPRLMGSKKPDLERAARIPEKAERNCLIWNSIETGVKVEPKGRTRLSAR